MSVKSCLKFLHATSVIVLALVWLLAGDALALETDIELSVQGSLFTQNGAWPRQENQAISGAGTIKLYHETQENLQLSLEAFYRIGSEDQERTHGDLRLAEALYFTDDWELHAGFGRIFWGATEFVHLVDIINQTDQVEALDGEEKLGQPMLHLTVPRNWGVVEAFVLPWFRERTFPGVNGRFRTPLPVDTAQAMYESGAGQHHTDLSIRYSTILGDADIGVYYFNGTARNPVLLLSSPPGSPPVLIPYYEQIGQAGLDLQMVAGEWLLKGEAYYRVGQSRSYAATTFGFEYTFTGIAESMMDLGIIGEYVYDDRDDGWLPTIYDNDIMGGVRLAVNDMDDSQILFGIIHDIPHGSTIVAIEASRRMGDSIRFNLDASFFLDMDILDPAASLSRDDHIQLEIVWYW